MKFNLSLVLRCALLLCCAASPAWAEKADRNQPMNIEADALRYDDVKQLSVFTGNVVITKGSLMLRGARIEVRQDPQGYQFGVAVGVPGRGLWSATRLRDEAGGAEPPRWFWFASVGKAFSAAVGSSSDPVASAR